MTCGQISRKFTRYLGDYRLAPSRLIRSHRRLFPSCELARWCLGIQKQLALLELCKRAQRAAISVTVILVHSSFIVSYILPGPMPHSQTRLDYRHRISNTIFYRFTYVLCETGYRQSLVTGCKFRVIMIRPEGVQATWQRRERGRDEKI
jgi:hypothetical protein